MNAYFPNSDFPEPGKVKKALSLGSVRSFCLTVLNIFAATIKVTLGRTMHQHYRLTLFVSILILIMQTSL